MQKIFNFIIKFLRYILAMKDIRCYILETIYIEKNKKLKTRVYIR